MPTSSLARALVAFWILGAQSVLAQDGSVELPPRVREVHVQDSHRFITEPARAYELRPLEGIKDLGTYYADPETTLDDLLDLPEGTYVVVGEPGSDSYLTGTIKSGAFWPGTLLAGRFVPGVHQADEFRPGLFTRGGFLDGLLIDDQHFAPGIVFRERFIAGVFRGQWFIPGIFRGETFIPGMIIDGYFVPGGFFGKMGFVPGLFAGGGFIPGRSTPTGFEPGTWQRGGFRRGPGGELVGVGFGERRRGRGRDLGGFSSIEKAGELGGFGPARGRVQASWGPGGAFRYVPGVGLMPQFIETSASLVAAGSDGGPDTEGEDDSDADNSSTSQAEAGNVSADESETWADKGERVAEALGSSSTGCIWLDEDDRKGCAKQWGEVGRSIGETIDDLIHWWDEKYPADPWGDGGFLDGHAPFYPADIDGPTGPVFRSVELYPADPDAGPLGPHFHAASVFYPADIDGDGPSLPVARELLRSRNQRPALMRRHDH